MLKLKKSIFKSEKELLDFVEERIVLFCKNCLNDSYVEHVREKKAQNNLVSFKGRSVDLFIKCENYTYLIETKHPRNYRDNVTAIGQVLDYGRSFSNIDNLVLVILTDKYDYTVQNTIEHYNLPILYMYLNGTEFGINDSRATA